MGMTTTTPASAAVWNMLGVLAPQAIVLLAWAQRAGLVAWPGPVRTKRISDGHNRLPCSDHLAMSLFALRQPAGPPAQRFGI